VRALSADDLARLYDREGLVECLREAFRRGCEVPPRHHDTVPVADAPDGALLLMPAWTGDDLLGVKIVTVFPGNAQRALPAVMGGYYLASAATGTPLLTIDGTAVEDLAAARLAWQRSDGGPPP